jgi:exodeoxyribonuclease V alpha subunit
LPHTIYKKKERWPLLAECVASKALAYVDFAFAQQLLSDVEEPEEGLAALLCHMMHVAREGHLCIRVEGRDVFPDPRLSWLSDSTLYQQMLEAVEFIPSKLLTIDCEITKTPLTPICRWNNLLYLQKHWVYESLFLHHFNRLVEQKPSMQAECLEIDGLLAEQAQAVRSAAQNSLTIITGGPGTGKTYTAGYLIKMLLEQATKSELNIALAAPTGKAAANLQASLRRALQGSTAPFDLSAKTLHSLLKIHRRNPFGSFDAFHPHSADVILVDECSMIDVKMMAQLFSVVKSGARLILLGDKDQLPPVEAGSLFADITYQCLSTTTLSKHIVSLSKCMRSDLKEIVNFSKMVNQGKSSEVIEALNNKESSVIKRVDFSNGKQDLLDYVEQFFPSTVEDIEDLRGLMQ